MCLWLFRNDTCLFMLGELYVALSIFKKYMYHKMGHYGWVHTGKRGESNPVRRRDDRFMNWLAYIKCGMTSAARVMSNVKNSVGKNCASQIFRERDYIWITTFMTYTWYWSRVYHHGLFSEELFFSLCKMWSFLPREQSRATRIFGLSVLSEFVSKLKGETTDDIWISHPMIHICRC